MDDQDRCPLWGVSGQCNRDSFGTFLSVRYRQVSLMERCPLTQVLL